jgi:hypothetical protein
MAIDIACEQLLTFNQAAQYLPERSRPSAATWWRWWRTGVRGVRLETVLVGGRRYTTKDSVQMFAARLTAAADGAPVPVRSPARRERDIARAERKMQEKLGRTHRTARDGGGGT